MNRPAELSIVVPVYNEAETIANVLNDLQTELAGKIIYEIIVVNDGSIDDSQMVLEKIPHITLVSHKLNRGYGTSLKTGIDRAQHDWILTFDGDGSHLARQIFELLPYTTDHDLIIGSREGKLGYDTYSRRFGRKIVTRFAEYISQSSIKDINSGFRLFKKILGRKFWHLFPERFSFSSTLTVAAHAYNYSVKYVPIEVHKRKGGNSTINPAIDFGGFLNIILRLAIYFKPLRVFVPLSIFFFIAATGIVFVAYFLLGDILDTTFAVLIMVSLQMLTFGFIAEMIVKRLYS